MNLTLEQIKELLLEIQQLEKLQVFRDYQALIRSRIEECEYSQQQIPHTLFDFLGREQVIGKMTFLTEFLNFFKDLKETLESMKNDLEIRIE